MADAKISALTGATTPLAGTEVLPIVQSGSTVKVSIANLTAGRAVAMAGGSFTDNLTQSTADKGVNFTSNTPAAGMTSQLLNLYEEGTWTPALKVGATGSTGTYTRIGRQVTVRGGLTGPAITFGASSVISDNLPFATASEFTGVIVATNSTAGALARVSGVFVVAVTVLSTPVPSISFSATYFV